MAFSPGFQPEYPTTSSQSQRQNETPCLASPKQSLPSPFSPISNTVMIWLLIPLYSFMLDTWFCMLSFKSHFYPVSRKTLFHSLCPDVEFESLSRTCINQDKKPLISFSLAYTLRSASVRVFLPSLR